MMILNFQITEHTENICQRGLHKQQVKLMEN